MDTSLALPLGSTAFEVAYAILAASREALTLLSVVCFVLPASPFLDLRDVGLTLIATAPRQLTRRMGMAPTNWCGTARIERTGLVAPLVPGRGDSACATAATPRGLLAGCPQVMLVRLHTPQLGGWPTVEAGGMRAAASRATASMTIGGRRRTRRRGR